MKYISLLMLCSLLVLGCNKNDGTPAQTVAKADTTKTLSEDEKLYELEKKLVRTRQWNYVRVRWHQSDARNGPVTVTESEYEVKDTSFALQLAGYRSVKLLTGNTAKYVTTEGNVRRYEFTNQFGDVSTLSYDTRSDSVWVTDKDYRYSRTIDKTTHGYRSR